MKSIVTTSVFGDWFDALRDNQAKRRIQARIDPAEDGHFGDCKPVGKTFPKCEFIMGLATGFISPSVDWSW